MGLDTTHNCWHGPYSAFMRWRMALQEAAGWHPITDYSDPYWGFDTKVLNWDDITEDNVQGRWESLPEDPLVVLIAHSDCGGVLPVPALLPLAERLEELAAKMKPRQHRPGSTQGMSDEDLLAEGGQPRALYDGSMEATLRFAMGLREAARLGEEVGFH